MDNAYIDIYYFYTPCRILWKHWKEFMGESPNRPWVNDIKYSVPTIRISTSGTQVQEGSILDYMGVPTKIKSTDGRKICQINALPVRAYVKIWNEFFRDENLDVGAAFNDDDNEINYNLSAKGESLAQTLAKAISGSSLLPVNKYHDYFTSCLPAPQRGEAVNLGISGFAPVQLYSTDPNNQTDPWNYLKTQTIFIGKNKFTTSTGAVTINEGGMLQNNSNNSPTRAEVIGFHPNVPPKDENDYVLDSGTFWADMSGVSSATVNQLREALAVQHYYEALARGGTRYREIIRSIYGTEISDKTVQVPEYLGGGRFPVNISQVIQTSATDSTSPQGNTAAMSVTPFRESSFTKSFEEHGFVIGVMCIRHERTYQQGIERMWGRYDRLDYYVPQLANIGEQPVRQWEIYAGNEVPNRTAETEKEYATFGYQEAWADYRYKPNRVSGKMRSNAEGTLDAWHYADNYAVEPTLSSEWMKEGDKEIQRTLAVDNEPQFFGDIYVMNKTTRCMPLYSIPGLNKI